MKRTRGSGGVEGNGSRGEGGFSLVELTLALTIILVSSIGGFASQHVSRNLVRTSEETAQAVADLENCMERVLVETVDTLLDPDSPYPDDGAVAAFQGLNLTGETLVVHYPSLPATGLPDVLEIRLTITWVSFDQRTRWLTLRTSKAR